MAEIKTKLAELTKRAEKAKATAELIARIEAADPDNKQLHFTLRVDFPDDTAGPDFVEMLEMIRAGRTILLARYSTRLEELLGGMQIPYVPSENDGREYKQHQSPG